MHAHIYTQTCMYDILIYRYLCYTRVVYVHDVHITYSMCMLCMVDDMCYVLRTTWMYHITSTTNYCLRYYAFCCMQCSVHYVICDVLCATCYMLHIMYFQRI